MTTYLLEVGSLLLLRQLLTDQTFIYEEFDTIDLELEPIVVRMSDEQHSF
jgi:hypothetical protein